MKALTLWQPWASLVACGAKTCETRSWNTQYRGPLAIHAAKAMPSKEVFRALGKPWVWKVEEVLDLFSIMELPLGCIVAMADLSRVAITDFVVPKLNTDERLFGDWSTGRYAWQFKSVKPVNPPIPWRGWQRLWNLPDDALTSRFAVRKR